MTAADLADDRWYQRAVAGDVAAEEAVEDARSAMEERMAKFEDENCPVVP